MEPKRSSRFFELGARPTSSRFPIVAVDSSCLTLVVLLYFPPDVARGAGAARNTRAANREFPGDSQPKNFPKSRFPSPNPLRAPAAPRATRDLRRFALELHPPLSAGSA